MGTSLKRLVSLCLAVLMLISVSPVSAWGFAEDADTSAQTLTLPVVGDGGGGGGGGSQNVEISGGNGKVEATVTVAGTTANIGTLTKENMDKLVGGTSGSKIVIDLSGLDRDVDNAVIPVTTIEGIAKSGKSLELVLTNGKVTMDKAALKKLADSSKTNIRISVTQPEISKLNEKQSRAIKPYTVISNIKTSVQVANTAISKLKEGKLTVTIKLGTSAKNPGVFHVANDGTLTEIPATKNGNELVFETELLGDFVVVEKQETDAPEKAAFTDVAETAWYSDAVAFCVEQGLMNGVSEKEFAPNKTLTRAMLVTVLYRNAEEPAVNDKAAFADVDKGSWYAKAVLWAKENGIVNGVTANTFAPNANITREQIAAIMHRYAKYSGYDVSVGEETNILSYDDAEKISEYAIASMQYVVGSGLIKGKTATTLNPSDNATRAEIAAILQRFITANK